MTKEVRMPDGQIIYDVPEDVSDEEVINKYLNKKMGAEKQKEEELPVKQDTDIKVESENDEPTYGADFARAVTKYASGPVNAIYDTINESAKFLGAEDDVISERFKKSTVKSFVNAIPGVEVSEVLDAENKVRPTETVPGTVAEIAPYFVVGGALATSKVVAHLPRILKGVVAGAATDQILYTGEDNIANMLEDAELVEAEGIVKDLIEYVSIDEDDTTLEKRVKLLAEGALVGGGIDIILGSAKVFKKAKEMFNRKPSELTVDQQTEIVIDHLKEARQNVQYQTREQADLGFSETAETASQVAQQNSGPVRRFMQQMFTSRGYWTPAAYNAFQDAQYAQRQLVAQAENISNRLQQSLRSISDEAVSEKTARNVQRALEEDLGFHPQVAQQSRIDYVMNNYDVSADVAEEILNARTLIDDMSKTLANSSIPDNEFKKTILQNSGQYIRRSYRLFEDSGYKPSENIIQQAEDYLVQQQLKRSKDMSIDEAYEIARGQVTSILKQGEDAEEVVDYYSKVRRVNTEILKGRQDIPEPIRKLMGEITEPSENIILTVSKLARLNETNTFFESLNRFGANKYIFNNPIERNNVGYTVKITGTNSILDGKYTTPEMLTAIKERESVLLQGPNTGLVKLLRNFATAKAGSQAAKTVYSHVTHLRNVVGGAQFAVANGVNPFTKGAETYKVLQNRIARGGEKELDAMYEKYLRLGIINTNVRVNEFRALLETGYSSTADNFLDNVSKKLEGYGFSKEAQRLPSEIYMAVDDFYKVANFNRELETLQKAFPDEAVEVLEAQASRIVQNTFPNYDRVPKGIKSIRYLPLGNFVAFPTEIWRTSTNIIKQASSEINSGNPTLRARGLQRLAGFSTAMAGAGTIASSTAQLAGLSTEEAEAIQHLSETPWSKAPRNIARIDDKLYVNDTQFIDSYSVIKTPILEIYRAVQDGELKGQELDDYLAEAVLNASKSVLAPYVGESIITDAFADILIAKRSPTGRTSDGKLLFPEGKPATDQIIDGFAHILQAFEPGTLTSIRSLADAAFEKPNKTTGKPKDLNAELFTNLTGIRFTEFSAEDSLMYATKSYLYDRRNIISMQPDYVKKPRSVKEDYINRERKLYEYQQNLYLKIKAAETLIGKGATVRVLKDSGLTKEEIKNFQSGMFNPEEVSLNSIVAVLMKTPFEKNEKKTTVLNEMFKAYSDFSKTRLIPVDEKADQEESREPYAKGGEVAIPNAPREPDERIDRMTGQPYNIQAGKAFVDEEETSTRALFSKGGAIAKLLKKGKEGYEGFKKSIDDLTDNLFNEEQIDDVAQRLEETRDDVLYNPMPSNDPDIPMDEIDEFELDEYIELSLKDILTGGADAPVAPGTKTTEFSESLGRKVTEGINPESEEAEEFYKLLDKIDPDQNIYRDIQEKVQELRFKYSSLTQNLEGVGDLPPETLPMKQFLAKRIEDPSLSEKGREALAEAQANTLSKDSELRDLMNSLFKEMPEKAETTKQALDTDKAVREQQIQEFIKDSKKKEPVFRGISDFNEGEYDIAFIVPREIGAHVGTSGQANVILTRDIDPNLMVDRFTVSARGGEKIDPEEIQDFFTSNRETLEERPMPYTVSKGYVQIKNPLVIDKDFGSWNAAQMLSDTDPESFWGSDFGVIIEEAMSQGASNETIKKVLDENLNSLVSKSKLWNRMDDLKIAGQLSELEKRKADMLQADINRQMRKIIEDLGFDSIKYKNTVESSMVGEDDYSYILFKPNQFKSFAAEKFDVNDPRFRKNMGGYINEAFARNS